jgi:hypothetical protein
MRIFISLLIILFILAFLFPLSNKTNKNRIIYIPFRKGETFYFDFCFEILFL